MDTLQSFQTKLPDKVSRQNFHRTTMTRLPSFQSQRFAALRLVLASLCLSLWAITIGAIPANAIEKSSAPENAQVYFITPQNNETLGSTFEVKFGLIGMGIAPAGVDIKNTGHHHLLIDRAELPDLDKALPAGDDTVRHFGGGQTQTELTLAPGKHTLQLILGNYAHIPHDRPVTSDPIMVTVQ
jgi:hypothetical protein